MRARNIKPGFFLNDELLDLEPLKRIFFIGLLCSADAYGRLEDRPRQLRRAVLPDDTIDPEETLKQMADAGLIIRYSVNGHGLIQVTRFQDHQSPHRDEKARGSEYPAPPGFVDRWDPYDPKTKQSIPHPIRAEFKAATVQAPEDYGRATGGLGMNAERGMLKDECGEMNAESSRGARAGESAPTDSLAAISPNSPHHANAHLHYASAGPGARLYSTRNERVPETVAVIELWQAADRTQKLRAGEIKRAECFVLPREAVDNAAEVIAALQASDFARKWPFAVAFRPKNLQDLLNGAYSQAEDGSEAEAEERYAQLARQI